ncbi:MAG TPA: FixH family protein [Gemmatimonadaceae bacterium]|nr:FixH family protein [Gemmatimonadaceae bacterium]
MHTSDMHLQLGFAPANRTGQRSRHPLWPVMVVALPVALFAAAALRGVERPAVISSNSAAMTSDASGIVTSLGERRSHSGRYSAEVISTSPIVIGATQSWALHLSRRNRRVSHATVSAEAWMPETGQRSAVRPTVTYVGGGDYRIDDLRFDRAGWWNVALVIDGRAGTDSVAFNVIR